VLKVWAGVPIRTCERVALRSGCKPDVPYAGQPFEADSAVASDVRCGRSACRCSPHRSFANVLASTRWHSRESTAVGLERPTCKTSPLAISAYRQADAVPNASPALSPTQSQTRSPPS
jgi:hypothetical protein